MMLGNFSCVFFCRLFVFGEMSRPFAHFLIFFLVLSCMSSLYILGINSLSVASFASIFSLFEGCFFVLFMISFYCRVVDL